MMEEWIEVSKELPKVNQVVFAMLNPSDDAPIKIRPIKGNAVYDYSENKWLMYSKQENSMVEIQGTVFAWKKDLFPQIKVFQE